MLPSSRRNLKNKKVSTKSKKFKNTAAQSSNRYVSKKSSARDLDTGTSSRRLPNYKNVDVGVGDDFGPMTPRLNSRSSIGRSNSSRKRGGGNRGKGSSGKVSFDDRRSSDKKPYNIKVLANNEGILGAIDEAPSRGGRGGFSGRK